MGIGQKLSAAAQIILLGCYTTRYPDPRLVQQASDRWYRAICVRPNAKDISIKPLRVIKYLCVDPRAAACHLPQSGIVVLSDTIPESMLGQVLTHELGHALDRTPGGVIHVEQDQGIMSPKSYARNNRITQADIDMECKRVQCLCNNPE